MKKIGLIIITFTALLFTSCMSKFGYYTSFVDYSRYADEGFVVTNALSAPFDYTPVGYVGLSEHSGYGNTEVERSMGKYSADSIYAASEETSKKKSSSNDWIDASAQSALDATVEFARKSGADALIGVTINEVRIKGIIAAVEVKGMAVKRK